jgi:hypothetical protein
MSDMAAPWIFRDDTPVGTSRRGKWFGATWKPCATREFRGRANQGIACAHQRDRLMTTQTPKTIKQRPAWLVAIAFAVLGMLAVAVPASDAPRSEILNQF